MVDDGADWEFIFDGVFGFLSSPLWSAPMMSFIDAQSVVFEPTEENHLEWTEIHNKYRALVESLLTSYLKDVGITEQEFMKACTSPSIQRSLEMQQICEQLFAGEDFEIFKKMMIQRNVELELEALKLIQKRQGKRKGGRFDSSYIPTEEEIIQEVIRRSEEEYKEAQKKKSVDSETYNETIEKMISLPSSQSERLEQDVLTKQEDTKRVVNESIKRDDDTSSPAVEKVPEGVPQKPTPSPKIEEHVLPPCKSPSKSPLPKEGTTVSTSNDTVNKSPGKSSLKSPIKPLPKSPAKAPTETVKVPGAITTLPHIKKDPTSSEAANQWMESAKQENATSSTSSRVQKNASLSNEDIKKREKYLKEQRNRIQQMKNQEREKQLSSYSKNAPQRPASARAAKNAVTGEVTETTMSADEQNKLAMRRVLAEKLKKEVIYKDGF